MDTKIFVREITWRSKDFFPLGDGEGIDVLYLTEKGRAGVLKHASMKDWRWLTEKYKIKYWTYLQDLMLF